MMDLRWRLKEIVMTAHSLGKERHVRKSSSYI